MEIPPGFGQWGLDLRLGRGSEPTPSAHGCHKGQQGRDEQEHRHRAAPELAFHLLGPQLRGGGLGEGDVRRIDAECAGGRMRAAGQNPLLAAQRAGTRSGSRDRWNARRMFAIKRAIRTQQAIDPEP